MCGKWFKWNRETDLVEGPFDDILHPVMLYYMTQLNKDGTLDRRLQEDTIGGRYWISTVCLCICHSFDSEDCPLVFETMAFDRGNPYITKIGVIERTYAPEVFCERARTAAEARACHQRAIEFCSGLLEKLDTPSP